MFRIELLVSALITITLMITGIYLLKNNSYSMEGNIDKLSKEILSSQSLVLERSIKKSTASAKILGKHIESVNGSMQYFEKFSHVLFSSLQGITNLQLAPNGIVSKIYPLDGHEKALGHDIFKSDSRKKEAFIAKKSKELTIAGPFTLIQGEVAIIARNPIYLKNNNNDVFWGFSSTLIYLKDLIQTTNLEKLKDRNYNYRLKRIHPDTKKIDIFAGTKNFITQKIFTEEINLPNTKWYLDIEYTGSYISNIFMNTLYILNFVLSLLVGFFIYRLLNKPKELEDINKQLEIKVKEQTEYIQKDVNLISKYIVYSKTDLSGRIKEVSEAFCEVSGYKKEELIGQPHSIVRHPKVSKSVYENMWKLLESNKSWNGELKNLRKDGKVFWLALNIEPEYDKDGKKVGYFSIKQDITAKKTLEEQQVKLIHKSKMASLGEMIGHIAHQWRQPLSTISISASGLKLKNELKTIEENDIPLYCDSIVKNVNYLSETINTFRNFLKEQKEQKEVVIQERVDMALDIVANTLKDNNIELVKKINYDKPIYKNIILGELSQVIINIITNAKDALIDRQIESPYIKIDLFTNEQNIIITIEDNAGGIPNDIKENIFEPYFTTKHESLGTGLGLYMSYNIITKSLNGNIYAKNTDNGAKFIISFPIQTTL